MMVEIVAITEGHEQALRIGVVGDPVAGIVVEDVVGRLGEREVRLESRAEVALIAAPPHAEHESHMRRFHRRSDVERGVLAHHPLHRLQDESGPRNGRGLAGDDPPGVDRRRPETGLARVDDLDLDALAREFVAQGETEDAAPDDHRAHVHSLAFADAPRPDARRLRPDPHTGFGDHSREVSPR